MTDEQANKVVKDYQDNYVVKTDYDTQATALKQAQDEQKVSGMDGYSVQGEYSRNGYRVLELDHKVPWSNRSRKILIDGKKIIFIAMGLSFGNYERY